MQTRKRQIQTKMVAARQAAIPAAIMSPAQIASWVDGPNASAGSCARLKMQGCRCAPSVRGRHARQISVHARPSSVYWLHTVTQRLGAGVQASSQQVFTKKEHMNQCTVGCVNYAPCLIGWHGRACSTCSVHSQAVLTQRQTGLHAQDARRRTKPLGHKSRSNRSVGTLTRQRHSCSHL